jgi:two-component system OmpR family sensor kinase
MKKFKFNINRKSLKWQLLSRCLLVLISLLLIMEVSMFITTRHFLYNTEEQLLESRLRNVEVHSLEEIKNSSILKERATTLFKSMSNYDVDVTIIDCEGNVLLKGSKREAADSIPLLSSEKYKELLVEKNLKFEVLRNKDNVEYLALFSNIGPSTSPSGIVQLTTSSQSIHLILIIQFVQYAVGAILVLVLGIILGVHVINYTLKPLFNMTNTVEQITVGHLNTRLPEDNSQMEIDRLSKAFNEMLQDIETSFEKEQYIKEKMRQFVSDASHELRTPLTSIHGFVEVLLRGAAKNEKQLDLALNSILNESERLTKLVNDLLTLTRLDQHPSIELKEESFNVIIEELLPQLQIIAKERTLGFRAEKNIYIKANKDQIKQVIINLVQNAVQHTDDLKGLITLNLSTIEKDSQNLVCLKVIDNGNGIPEKDLTEVFDRFFRSESHRSRKHGGYGLGLSIVKSIIDAHQGKITVDSILGEGTIFTIYLKETQS